MLSLLQPPSFLSLFFFIIIISSKTPSCLSEDDTQYNECAPSQYLCGGRTYEISYPFRVDDPLLSRPEYCSYPGYNLTCDGNRLVARALSHNFSIKNINYGTHVLQIVDQELTSSNCPMPSRNSTIDSFSINSNNLDFLPFNYTTAVQNVTLYHNCTNPIQGSDLRPLRCLTSNNNFSYLALRPPVESEWFGHGHCNDPVIIPLMRTAAQLLEEYGAPKFGDALESGFEVEWMVGTEWCSTCEISDGRCGYHDTNPREQSCFCSNGMQISTCPSKEKLNLTRKIIIGLCAAFVGCIVTCVAAYLWYRKKQLTPTSSKLVSQAISSDPASKSELGNCNSLLPTHVFDYKELEEATNNFDPSKELGEGGFGTVYYGKLYDGRSVAVKRLYENFRRMEQFMNEIEILSRLRHPNLVALYGCTSRHSRELLLVYEFIPNGTVADHLHGGRAKAGALTWPIRMSIAIETAGALAHLHAVEIIHRDVKTNNILLDNNFRVKVADFGLSRLFPMDKTHVSTAPQGTPGYVDPDYHRCYQLTDKSDVFSFGVVLFELISSIPAVDITRHRHEINLSNMAINKIHNNALHELVDPSLGFESDIAARRSITLVAELAYRCLHDDKEMRPCMEEVLKVLQEINSSEYNVDKAEVLDIPSDDVVLLNKRTLRSPDSVTAPWISRDTTPNASG